MERPLRVLLSFSTRIGTGGVGTTAWHQATGLVRAGAEVSVACGSVERELPGVRVVAETMRLGPVNLPYRVLGFDRSTAYHDRRVARLVARRASEFDVVHSWPAGAEHTLRAARASGVLGVLERPNAHTAYAYEVVAAECARLAIPVDPDSPHVFDAARLAREEREYAAADALLCPSEFVASTHRARGEPQERLLRHRYGYDPARFSPERRSLEPRPFTAVFVGLVEPRKGLHFALEAWRAAGLGASGERLLVCGGVEPAYRTVLEPLLAQPGVELLGHVADPGAVMGAADALLLPSLEEGSALVTYEARACGCVLVVSDRAGAYARDERDALIHPAGDVPALTAHLRRLATEPGLLERLRTASLEGVPDLTWDAAAQALLDAYRTGLGRVARAA